MTNSVPMSIQNQRYKRNAPPHVQVINQTVNHETDASSSVPRSRSAAAKTWPMPQPTNAGPRISLRKMLRFAGIEISKPSQPCRLLDTRPCGAMLITRFFVGQTRWS